MSNNRFPIESLLPDALVPGMPACKALLLFRGQGGDLLEQLGQLYPQSHSHLYYIEDPTDTFSVPAMEAALKLQIPCILLTPGPEPAASLLRRCLPERISLVSRGSSEQEPFIHDLIEDPHTAYFSWIGFQNYHTDPALKEAARKKACEMLRLGSFRHNSALAEPLLREAACHFIDMRAVRAADAPDAADPSPNGLYAEEICTLARYMGLSPRFVACHIYGYPAAVHTSDGGQIAKLVAQVIWHLTEGLCVSLKEDPQRDEAHFERKAVQMGEDGQELVFLHSVQSGRWWMEVPNFKLPSEPLIISCSTEDYMVACKGEVPTKWLFYYQKSNSL